MDEETMVGTADVRTPPELQLFDDVEENMEIPDRGRMFSVNLTLSDGSGSTMRIDATGFDNLETELQKVLAVGRFVMNGFTGMEAAGVVVHGHGSEDREALARLDGLRESWNKATALRNLQGGPEEEQPSKPSPFGPETDRIAR